MGLQKSNGDVASTIDDTTPQPSAREAKIQLQLQRDAARARKGLLANFAKYDALAKRIRDLPYGDDVGLKRLKENVFLRAGAFLQTNVSVLDCGDGAGADLSRSRAHAHADVPPPIPPQDRLHPPRSWSLTILIDVSVGGCLAAPRRATGAALPNCPLSGLCQSRAEAQ